MGYPTVAWAAVRERLEPSVSSDDDQRAPRRRSATIWRRAAPLGLGLGALLATGGLAGAAPTAPAPSNPAAASTAPPTSASAIVPSAPTSASAAPSGTAAQPVPSGTTYPPGYGPPPAGSSFPPGYSAPPEGTGYPPGYGPPPTGSGYPPGDGPPPTGSGYPPGYGPPPTGAGYSPGYVPPPAGYGYPPAPYGYYPAPPPEPPETLPYEEGQQIPPGYALEKRRLVGLAIAGGATFGAIWLVSLAAGVALENDAREQEEEYDEQTAGYYYYEDSGLGIVDRHDVVWPLALPLVGPFITLGTAHAEGPGIAILLLDGVIQTGGLAMLITGLVVENDVLVLQVGGDSAMRVTPTLGPTGAGFGIQAEM